MPKPKPARKARTPKPAPVTTTAGVGAMMVEHIEARWPKAFTRPEECSTVHVITAEVMPAPQPMAIDKLLRSGHVMSMLGINRKQLELSLIHI